MRREAERIEWFIEVQAVLQSMIRLHPPPFPLSPVSSCLSFSVFLCAHGPSYGGERGGRGRAWSRIIGQQKSLGLYKSFNPLWREVNREPSSAQVLVEVHVRRMAGQVHHNVVAHLQKGRHHLVVWQGVPSGRNLVAPFLFIQERSFFVRHSSLFSERVRTKRWRPLHPRSLSPGENA
jgi:hypothetical protein